MSTRAPFSEPPDGDYTYRKLVAKVIKGDQKSWTEFVERFSNLLFSLLWRYANGDEDLCANLYLYVIEGLHQSNETGETFFRLRRYPRHPGFRRLLRRRHPRRTAYPGRNS